MTAADAVASFEVPEPGQLVRARGRSWVVAEVDRGDLDRPQHLVSLTSVEDDPDHASLHAKCAVADHDVAFVTSANLTSHALDRNMELGVLITGGDTPKRLAEHLDGLITTRVIDPWPP